MHTYSSSSCYKHLVNCELSLLLPSRSKMLYDNEVVLGLHYGTCCGNMATEGEGFEESDTPVPSQDMLFCTLVETCLYE
jgi:hypothetical protein